MRRKKERKVVPAARGVPPIAKHRASFEALRRSKAVDRMKELEAQAARLADVADSIELEQDRFQREKSMEEEEEVRDIVLLEKEMERYEAEEADEEEAEEERYTRKGAFGISMVSCGRYNTAVITVDGKLFTFGNNENAELGQGSLQPLLPSIHPLQVDGFGIGEKNGAATFVACGLGHVAVITENGRLFTFGANGTGQLGYDTEPTADGRRFGSRPKVVDGFGGEDHVAAVSVACGIYHTAVVTEQGRLFTFGGGNFGQLGHGEDRRPEPRPRMVAVLDDVFIEAVSCGYYFTAVVTRDGRILTFGGGAFGNLGNGQFVNKNIPQLVIGGPKKVGRVVCGGSANMMVIGVSGNMFTCGRASNCRLGRREAGKGVNRLERVDGNVKASSAAIGSDHTAMISLREGALFTFGSNEYGQLGGVQDGITCQPQRVAHEFAGDTCVQVACGESHTAVVTRGGRLFTFGRNTHGQLGRDTGDSEKNPKPVEVFL